MTQQLDLSQYSRIGADYGYSGHCRKCKRPLTNLASMAIGYGPVCRASMITGNDTNNNEEARLVTLKQPIEYDIVLRFTNGTADQYQTNVPWSCIIHSPTGFSWGYSGSGPADLALNILNAFCPPGYDKQIATDCYKGRCSLTAEELHQKFKAEFIAGMPKEGGVIKAAAIREFIKNNPLQE